MSNLYLCVATADSMDHIRGKEDNASSSSTHQEINKKEAYRAHNYNESGSLISSVLFLFSA